MSTEGISALERGYRRSPQRETLELLAGALALDAERRRAFEEAAARSGAPRRAGGASVTVGPWSDGAPSNLPFAIASFIGRERELAEIAALVRNHRLITVTGAGGVGKTQTTLQVARGLSADVGVCFVALASNSDPSLVTAAIASALGVAQVPRRSLIDSVIAYLKNRTILLLLDNCEHVVNEAANVAETILASCANVRIIATSREPLMAAGERRYQLSSLSSDDAVALFVDRAQGVDIRFTLSDENAPLIAEICRRLDGIPLAIELAAARINLLSLKALNEKLDDRLPILTGGRRTALPQQRTMRATIDWSYELLSAQEQRVFERLSVFAGGCTLAEATAVCAGGEVNEHDVLGRLASLVDKSLVRVDFEPSEPRYRLLESFRRYAHEKLASRGEAEKAQGSHASAYLQLAERVQERIRSDPVEVWQEIWSAEQDNWRAALRWALIGRGDIPTGLALTGLLGSWDIFGFVERREWTVVALERTDAETPALVLARLRKANGDNAFKVGEYEAAFENHRIALECYRGCDDKLSVAGTQCSMGYALLNLGRTAEARATFEEALVLAREANGHGVMAAILSGLALVADDIAVVRGYIAEALEHSEATGNKFNTAYVLINLSECEFRAGDAESALAHATKALVTARPLSAANARTAALNNMTVFLIAMARYDEAEERARELLDLARERGLDRITASALEHLAIIAALRPAPLSTASESYETLARILAFVNARIASLSSVRDAIAQPQYDRAVRCTRDALGSDDFERQMAIGAALSEERAIAEALAL